MAVAVLGYSDVAGETTQYGKADETTVPLTENIKYMLSSWRAQCGVLPSLPPPSLPPNLQTRKYVKPSLCMSRGAMKLLWNQVHKKKNKPRNLQVLRDKGGRDKNQAGERCGEFAQWAAKEGGVETAGRPL